ncbi:phage major capsid protein [candidate division KSB1 bacterium]
MTKDEVELTIKAAVAAGLEQKAQEIETAFKGRLEDELEGLKTVRTERLNDDPGVLEKDDPHRFTSLGEQLTAVHRAAVQKEVPVDSRLKTRATGMSESVPSEGGFLVQTDFAEGLLKRLYDNAVILPSCRRITVSSNSNRVAVNAIDETSRADGSRWGGVQAYWADEAATKTKSKPKFRRMELVLEKLIGLCYATDELLADSSALESVINDAFTEEFDFRIQDAIINGAGAGQPLGVMNAGCLVSVAKESGQAAGTLLAENVEKMFSRMWARSIPKAVWYINQDVWPQIFQLYHTVGDGGVPMYIEPGRLPEAPHGALLGRPIRPIEQCQTLGTVGDVIFADFSQYVIAQKGGMEAASSIHVQFTTDETAFRFVLRIDGQPAWNSALTPFKGSNTLSPFVTLATRSS